MKTNLTTPTYLAPRAGALTLEHGLWIAVALTAVSTRAWALGGAPLSNAEASQALGAIALVQPGLRALAASSPILNPLLSSLQALLFAVFAPDDGLARLPAMLAGVALCLTPALARERLGRGPAIAIAASLAMSPTLWFLSRQSDGTMLSWALALTALFLAGARPLAAAIFAGLLLATGQNAMTPLFLAGVALAAQRIRPAWSRREWAALGIAFGLGSTGLMLRPQGLGDAFAGFAAWGAQLGGDGPLPFWRSMYGFGLFEPMLWLGGSGGLIVALFRGPESRARSLPWLAVLALGLILLAVSRGRTVGGLVPLIIGSAILAAPLWSIIADVWRTHEWSIDLPACAATFVLLTLAGLQVRDYASQGQAGALVGLPIAAAISVAIAFGVTALRDAPAGLRGTSAAVLASIALYSTGAGMQLTQIAPTNPAEPYNVATAQPGVTALSQAIERIGMRAYTDPYVVPVHLSDDAPASLRWALRNQTHLVVGPVGADDDVAITSERQKLNQGNFVGSAFAVGSSAALSNVKCTPLDSQGKRDCGAVGRWVAFRDGGEVMRENWIVWLRSDIASRVDGVTPK